MQENLEFLSKSQLFTLDGKLLASTVGVDDRQVSGTATTRDLTNKVIDQKYKIIGLLGEGGMGAVYKARHLNLNKDVALKMLRATQLTDELWQRFLREAKAIAQINHINIVHVFDYGVDESNFPYYTMECLVGESLADRLAASKYLPASEALPIFLQVCNGLMASNGKGIVHRDIKPANIFLVKEAGRSSDLVKIVDFGVAGLLTSSMEGQKLTSTGVIFGSPLYMSPEQCLGHSVLERADIYACACAFFETLTGHPPFAGANAFATMEMHLNRQAPELESSSSEYEFPRRLKVLIARMMEKDPDKRPQTFSEVVSEVEFIIRAQAAVQPSADIKQTSSVPRRNDSSSEDRAQLDSSREYSSSNEYSGDHSEGWFAGTKARVLGLVCIVFVAAIGAGGIYFFGVQRLHPQQPAAVKSYFQGYLPGKDHLLRFVFPNESLGLLTVKRKHGGSNKHDDVEAAGTVDIYPPKYVHYKPSPMLIQHPELFDGFRPSDFGHITLDGPFTDADFEHLARFAELDNVDFAQSEVSDRSVPVLNKLSKLKQLRVYGSNITGAGLVALDRLPDLTFLDASNVREIRKVLPKLESGCLQALRVNTCGLTNSDLSEIGKIKTLEQFDANDNPAITDMGVKALTNLKHLRELQLETATLTPSCIDDLAKLQTLQNLKISDEDWNETDLRRLRSVMPKGCKFFTSIPAEMSSRPTRRGLEKNASFQSLDPTAIDAQNSSASNSGTKNSGTKNSGMENSETKNSETENSMTKNSETKNSEPKNSEPKFSEPKNAEPKNSKHIDTEIKSRGAENP